MKSSEQVQTFGSQIERSTAGTSAPDDAIACCSPAQKRMLGLSTLAIYAAVIGYLIYRYV